ncbi:MAG: excinuclease ABC subunit UvrC [Acholeplasmataceae bacterium]|nr:excinuclease ABC subunit UvrC [Acholeplasmataceae bacterium]MDD4203930.1 excinuclease ABC subunit UvrC [Acholeplasmataceae bacterium]MDD4824443.1 excinuclease ABC subunit UvrC [Acholeplasmataceae bacterium]MDY0316925.1 excinuclease ABC subunit UvrC [Acholeplasmatales bacterium]
MELIKEKLKLLPDQPGSYQFYNKFGKIIYVGKAKNLKSRVKSYFTGAHNSKTTKLVSEIADFSTLITKTEREALILELNLIKENLPKYNIKLTDDSTYPFIVITNGIAPKIMVSREPNKGDGIYFGPYPNVYSAKETVRLLNKIYPVRKCEKLPKKACLYYHMNQCLAPCIAKEPINWDSILNEVKAFLKGDTKKVKDKLKEEMYLASEELKYEKALEYKNLIDHIDHTTEKQLMNLNDFKDRDFIAYASDEEDVSLQILKMRSGKIVDSSTDIFPKYLDASEQVITYLYQYYDTYPMPDEVLFQDSFSTESLVEAFGKKAIIPKIGDKKKLVDLAFKNALYDLENERLLHKNVSEKMSEAQEAFKDLLGLDNISRIDIFDNAHLFGANPISCMVVYKDGKPAKNHYRKYKLKNTKKADDYGAFKEVIYRRYQKALFEKQALPDMILVDGGKGQVSSALNIIESLGLTIPVVGLKKNDKHQLDALVYNNNDVPLEKGTYLYTLLGKMSEEVHRFAITFHRQQRSKTLMKSKLDDIDGVGPARKRKLLEKFITIDNMIQGSSDDYKSIGINETLRDRIINQLKES